MLIFDTGRKTLQQWIVVDGQGRRTTVSLNKLVMGKRLAGKLFHVARPGQGKQVRKKVNFGSSQRK